VSDLLIRRATGADAGPAGELARTAYAPWEQRLGGRPLPMDYDYAMVVATMSAWVAERDGEIVGLLVLGDDGEGFFVDNIAVDPTAQGTGVGGRLLAHAEREALAAGFDSIYLWTHEGMTENREIYEATGYAEFDRRPPRPGAPPVLVYLRKPLA
jgi:GNAT superfamily N-acetyltransferase